MTIQFWGTARISRHNMMCQWKYRARVASGGLYCGETNKQRICKVNMSLDGSERLRETGARRPVKATLAYYNTTRRLSTPGFWQESRSL